ncbi:Cytochrome c oxidase assembly protein cox15 [Thalictrum thalictroides]|uniref:Cytochrome c oxidase assembly protein cox15 n=1 Tax=Thalictrum thalictroides TaxID=46969 RepID=A0A7J6V3H9_THATH|nr:Cytochrome c oxidase assembly protein cox15 [Thalictrum thalictroides]
MVKCGLEEPEFEYVKPRVSPYQLAAHLTSAFSIYCGLLWTGLSVVMPEPSPALLGLWFGFARRLIKRLASCCKVFDWEYHGHGSPSSHSGNINTSILSYVPVSLASAHQPER